MSGYGPANWTPSTDPSWQQARDIAIVGVGAAFVDDALVVAILEYLESHGRQAEAAATLNASTSAWRAGQRSWTDETRRSFEDATVAYLRLVDAAIAAVRPELRAQSSF